MIADVKGKEGRKLKIRGTKLPCERNLFYIVEKFSKIKKLPHMFEILLILPPKVLILKIKFSTFHSSISANSWKEGKTVLLGNVASQGQNSSLDVSKVYFSPFCKEFPGNCLIIRQ